MTFIVLVLLVPLLFLLERLTFINARGAVAAVAQKWLLFIVLVPSLNIS